MKKIILLTGGGDLPLEVIEGLKKKKIKYFCIIFNNNPVSKVIYKNEHKLIDFGKVISELFRLKTKGYNNILMVGNIKRPSLKDIKPDLNSLKLIPKFTKHLLQGGDNNLLSFCVEQLQKFGFKVLDLRKIIPENFLNYGNQTEIKLTKINLDDIKKGKLILNHMSKFDIGQSIIMQQGNVIAIEAAQGTDRMIIDSYPYLNLKQNCVLIKLAKIRQCLKADLPTIGINTLKNCNKFGISGITYSANKTLFLKKNRILDYCNKKRIFLYGI